MKFQVERRYIRFRSVFRKLVLEARGKTLLHLLAKTLAQGCVGLCTKHCTVEVGELLKLP